MSLFKKLAKKDDIPTPEKLIKYAGYYNKKDAKEWLKGLANLKRAPLKKAE